MQSVYGFDCYEASNNAVEDIEETRESLLDSAYALTPAEERELEAEEVRGRVLWCPFVDAIVLTPRFPHARACRPHESRARSLRVPTLASGYELSAKLICRRVNCLLSRPAYIRMFIAAG
jgi:hypothetical protein